MQIFSNFLGLTSAAITAQTNKPAVPLKWFIFREDCYDTFFAKHDFLNQECLKFSISKLIGYLIIAGAFIIKVPQILKIMKNKSVAGISKYMFYIEMMMYINSSGYSIHNKIPFSVYGENLIILAQNIIIVFLFWTYNKSVSIIEKLFVMIFLIGYSYVLFNDSMLTEKQWELIAQTNILFLIMSRIPQILTNFMNRSTGHLAFLTFFLGFAGSAARLATVLVETDDFLYRLQFIIGTILNGTLVLQFVMYWNNKVQAGDKDSDKKKKKE
eukprot:403336391